MNLAERAYRRLLRAYPEAYRKEYGEAMVQLFRDLCRDAAERRGAAGLIAVWGFLFRDLMGSLIREHRAEGRKAMQSLYRKLTSRKFVKDATQTLLGNAAILILVLSVFKLTSLPLTEGQLVIGLLCACAVSLQLAILAVLVTPAAPAPSQGHLKE